MQTIRPIHEGHQDEPERIAFTRLDEHAADTCAQLDTPARPATVNWAAGAATLAPTDMPASFRDLLGDEYEPYAARHGLREILLPSHPQPVPSPARLPQRHSNRGHLAPRRSRTRTRTRRSHRSTRRTVSRSSGGGSDGSDSPGPGSAGHPLAASLPGVAS